MMKITIEYDSSWRNSFLNGSNNEPLPKKGRDYIASMTELKKAGNFIQREITTDTVLGILNRLIGDQRKLYQARSKLFSSQYYFEDIESSISFQDDCKCSSEVVYIRNMNGSFDQNAYSGMIKASDPVFLSDYSQEFWGVLAFTFDELCVFILEGVRQAVPITLDPLAICDRFEALGKLKPVVPEGQAEKARVALNEIFPDVSYFTKKDLIDPKALYCSALYLQLIRLDDKYDMTSVKTKSGGISGVSKRLFTKKDFMRRYTTGSGKRVWGNPYMKKDKVKGQGEITSSLTKASGRLVITIDVDQQRGHEIKALIENAGVSSFYLGKKGLAYVSKIRV